MGSFFVVGTACPVPCGMLSLTPGLYLLDVGSTSPGRKPKVAADIAKCALGSKISPTPLKTAGLTCKRASMEQSLQWFLQGAHPFSPPPPAHSTFPLPSVFPPPSPTASSSLSQEGQHRTGPFTKALWVPAVHTSPALVLKVLVCGPFI